MTVTEPQRLLTPDAGPISVAVDVRVDDFKRLFRESLARYC
jgi:hypothetical protein